MAWKSSHFIATRSDKTSTFAGNVTVSGDLAINGTMTFGDASTDTLTVNGAATFNADSTFSTNKKLQFRDTGIYINSGADGKLTISADGTGTDDITLNGTVTFAAGITLKHVSKTSDYSATVDDCVIGVDTSSGTVTVTLPSAGAVAGKVFVINDEGGAAATNNVVVATEGSETIDGSSSASITSNYGTLRLYSDGSNFFTF